MVNPDSDLARAHPDWVLRAPAAGCRRASRHQQVLDLADPDAYAYLLERLDALLGEYDIAYLKWDHNRDLVEAGAPAARPGVHAPDPRRLPAARRAARAGTPGWRSSPARPAAAGSTSAILERTDRVWASDCNDALERQQIQRWTALLLPPELIGATSGRRARTPPAARTTSPSGPRTALFGHFGIE